MKKTQQFIIGSALFTLIMTSSFTTFAKNDISVVLNGERVIFDSSQPVIHESRTLIPVRAVFEKAGWGVDWNASENLVVISNSQKAIFITINSVEMNVCDIGSDQLEVVELDVPAMIINDSTMIPLRAVCEELESDVNWDDTTKTVYIEME